MQPYDARSHEWHERKRFVLIIGAIITGLVTIALANAADQTCQPTPPDQLGPMYKAGAPMRTKVGTGHVLQGVVRSSRTCQPLPEALIEIWLAGPHGRYDDAYRASIIADDAGRYRFESHVPGGYFGRPPHIHMRVSAANHRVLVTQHYPQQGQTQATLDLVLQPQ
jgi:protocatechuate 3,4-dioxygenase beta subunit